MEDNLSFYEQEERGAPVHLVSIPLELGSDERGLAQTPRYLSSQGAEKMLSAIRREVAGSTSIACPKESRVASAGRMKHAQEIAAVAKRSSAAVERAIRRGSTTLVLGGDHSISIGSIAGAAAACSSLGVIYIDAHPDCNTDETTITGNVHGMVTSALLGYGNPLLADILKRHLSPEHFLYIGLKDMDAAEISFLREHSLRTCTMLDIAAHGLSRVFAAVHELSRSVERVWISMDMDSIDETYAPGVGLPNKGGFTRREILALAQYIGTTCDVAGLDVVELLPEKDIEGKTAQLALELTARFLGNEYSWYRRDYIDTYRQTNVTNDGEAVVSFRQDRLR